MELIDLRVILIVALILIPLERLIPLHVEQKVLRRHWRNDPPAIGLPAPPGPTRIDRPPSYPLALLTPFMRRAGRC